MCGRYALGIRASHVRQQLQQLNLRVDEAPADDEARETYNFPPGAYGLVYRADVPDSGLNDSDIEALQQKASQAPTDKPASELLHAQDEQQIQTHHDTDETQPPPPTSPSFMKASDLLDHTSNPQTQLKYQLKAMKWGLIPFWTKRSPDYSSMLRTINCCDDSLIENRGLWNTMKQRKRCLVLAQGFYEWLKPRDGRGPKTPHFVKRADGQLMCLAGLWDCVKYEDSADGEKLYTYTVITTSSNAQLQFLHDRMPVILDPGSAEMQIWLDATQNKWSKELQAVLKPYEGELECYPVSREVGKVGNNSPDFIVPLASKENKQNIANFFGGGGGGSGTSPVAKKHETQDRQAAKAGTIKQEADEERVTEDHDGTENSAPLPVPSPGQGGLKRKIGVDDEGQLDHATKQIKREPVTTPQKNSGSFKIESSPARTPVTPSPNTKTAAAATATVKTGVKKTRDPTSNAGLERKLSPAKHDGSLRITNFFDKTDNPD